MSDDRSGAVRDDDFEQMLAAYDRIIADKALQQELLDAGLLIRVDPATGEPLAATPAAAPELRAVAEAALDVAMQRGGDPALRANGLAVTSRRAMDRLVEALVSAGLTQSAPTPHDAEVCGLCDGSGYVRWTPTATEPTPAPMEACQRCGKDAVEGHFGLCCRCAERSADEAIAGLRVAAPRGVPGLDEERERAGQVRALDALLGMMDTADKGDTWPDMIDTAKAIIRDEGLGVLEARIARASTDDDWRCIDCDVPLEPGAPPICSECVEDGG